jgi:adenosylhomocysteine nucleosidase
MREELASLARRLGSSRRGTRLGGLRVRRGDLGRVPVLLARTGEGPLLAGQGARSLLAHHPVELLLAVGVAGGLTRNLGAGDLIAARAVGRRAAAMRETDPEWLERASRCAGVSTGIILSAARILATAEEKAAARARLGSPAAAVVDLESAAYARAAAAARVPFLAVRAVLDTADEDLPLDLERCRDGRGAIRRWKVVLRALPRPGRLARLGALHRRVADASERLARFVDELLNGDE